MLNYKLNSLYFNKLQISFTDFYKHGFRYQKWLFAIYYRVLPKRWQQVKARSSPARQLLYPKQGGTRPRQPQ